MYGELSTHLRVEAFVDALSMHGISWPWLFTSRHACFCLEHQAPCLWTWKARLECPFDSLWIQYCTRDLCGVSLA